MAKPPDPRLRGPAPAPGASRSVVRPIEPSVVYASPSIATLHAQYDGRVEGYTYAREGHPNATALAARIAEMEGLTGGLVMGSGMAAISAAVMALARAGGHVIGGDQLYGRSLRLLNEDLPRLGIETSLIDLSDAAALQAALRPETTLILIETVANPTLRLPDLVGIAEIARAAGVPLAVDNTFATPLGCQPAEFGADIVIHSVTKLLAGHSDVTLGFVGTSSPDLLARIEAFAVTTGLTASPYDCWLAERGLMTFGLRYERAERNAADLAAHIAADPKALRVVYPGLPGHPDAARAQSLLAGRNGHMLSFEVAGGEPAAERFLAGINGRLAFAPTLGDVSTTLSHPASSSHRGLTPEGRAALGISDGFFRVSVGIEEIDFLQSCFSEALASV